MLKNRRDFLSKLFNQFRVEYDSVSHLPREIIAKLWDRPFTDFVFANERQKRELGKKVADFYSCQGTEISNLLKEFSIA